MNRDWRNDAACKDAPLAVFFPDGKADPIEHLEYARNRYCRECPVLQDCARNALDGRETHGIWAGIWISQNSGKVARRLLNLVAASGAIPPPKPPRPDRGAARWPLCGRGHLKTPDNSRWEGPGKLRCLTCDREYRRDRRKMGKAS